MIRHERWLLKVLLCAAAVSAAGCYGSDEIPKLKGPGVLQFSAADYSVSESALTVTISVTRTGGREGMVGVSYATSNGSAVQPGDYAAATGTLSWADGDMEAKTFTVTVEDDPTAEGDETVNLVLSLPTGGATLGLSAAVLTILDNDAPPEGIFQFASATYSVNEGEGTVTITVTRTGGSTGDVTVNYYTANGSAVAPDDYTAIPQATPGTLNWNSGDSSPKTFTVTIVDDGDIEASQDFTVTLDNPSAGGLGTVAETTVTITDNDNHGTLAFSAAAYSVDETGGRATITVTRTGGSQGVVGVTYATANGTATQPDDYATATGTLSWPDGNMDPRTFDVDIVDDTLDETNETILLSLSGVTGGATPGLNAATLTILDNDSAGEFVFELAAYSQAEDAAPGTVTVTVRRVNGNDGAVSVQYATSDGTATLANNDYTAASGTFNWAHGETADKTFAVSITADTNAEPNETVNLALSNPTGGAALGTPNTAVLTILNDDASLAGTIVFSSATYTVSKAAGSGNLVVRRTLGSDGLVGVTVQTVTGGSASYPSEYNAINQGLSWANGNFADQNVTLTLKGGADVGETIHVELSNPTGGAVLGTPVLAVVTIID